MTTRQEYKIFSDRYFEWAKKCHQKSASVPVEDYVTKIMHLAAAIQFLLVSDDLLINWFLYPMKFKSRSARYSSFESERKIQRQLNGKPRSCVMKHPFKVLGIRNMLLYLSNESEETIKNFLDDLTLKKIDKIFKEADYVRNILEKL